VTVSTIHALKKSDVYEVAIKILGLYLIKDLLSSFSSVLMNLDVVWSSWGRDEEFGGIYFYSLFFSLLFSGAILFVMWMFLFRTERVVEKICKPEDFSEQVRLVARKRDIIQVSIVITALVLLVWTLPEFIFRAGSYISAMRNHLGYTTSDVHFAIIGLLKVIAALIFLGFSGSLANYFSRQKETKEN
jgi:hypothetical protein